MQYIMCLDIGNTHIYGGVFVGGIQKLDFRYPSQKTCSSDEIGVFLRTVLKENTIDPKLIQAICIGSVVPSLDYSVNAACIKYFNINPLFLNPEIEIGLNFKIKNPLELGADRIANAVAAVELFPNKNIILVDLGTATTVCVITAEKEYLGGIIMPGIKLAMESLHQNTAKLAPVDIIIPKQILGKTTTANIQSGLYYGQLGAIEKFITTLKKELFVDDELMILATGGYSHLFRKEKIFTTIIGDLVLQGLLKIYQKNQLKKL